jgi:hypothetical protein
VKDAWKELEFHQHPDPYINPHMPGGSSYMRNPAVPLEVVYPSGIPAGYSRFVFSLDKIYVLQVVLIYFCLIDVRRQLNVDMSYVAPGQEFGDKVFVDFINREYWIDRK